MAVQDVRKLVAIFEGITSKLAESKEPNRLYDVAVQIAMDNTGAQACSLYLEQSITDPEKGPDRIVMVSGAGFEEHRIGVTYAEGQGLTGTIWKTSQSIRLDTQAQIEDPVRGWQGLHNDRVVGSVPGWASYSLIGVPLKIGDRTIGVLKVENKKPQAPACFSEDDQFLLETIASTIALAIENERYSEQSYSLILNALRDLSGMLVSSEVMSFQMLCDRIVEKCIEVFNSEACSLYIQDDKSPEDIVMVSGAGYENLRRGARYQRGKGLTGTIWAKGKPVKYDTRQEVENGKAHGWQGLYNQLILQQRPDWECCSLIGVPLRIGARWIGVLKVENKKPFKTSHFTHNELRSLEVIASNIALALEMRRQQQLIFSKGMRAREFTHNVSSKVRTARSAAHRALEAARAAQVPQDMVKRLEIVATNLDWIDSQREQVSAELGPNQRTTVSMNELLRRVGERCGVLEGEGIRLVGPAKLPDDVCAFVALPEVLTAFDMLIENAIDAVHGGPAPTVWIQVHRNTDTRQPVDKANILFVDNGPGFTREQRQQFEDNKDIASTKHAGLGSGLRQAHHYFADNQIYLKIIDPPPDMTFHGAAFEIDIPIHLRQHLRVLAIDDDRQFLELLQLNIGTSEGIELETLTSHEILIRAAASARDALTTLDRFDLILLDCYWGDSAIDGPELRKKLQTVYPRLAERIMLMSGEPEFKNRPGLGALDKIKEVCEQPPEAFYDMARRGRTQA